MKVVISPLESAVHVNHQTPYDDRAWVTLATARELLAEWMDQNDGNYASTDDGDIAIATYDGDRVGVAILRENEDHLYSLDALNEACGHVFAWAEGVNEPNPAVQTAVERELEDMALVQHRALPTTWGELQRIILEVMGAVA